ncbi:hypothetical protein RND81_10G148900 [Saponaria officinalis]|uniref:Protein kinase domain-containing protein n=1 Tax=Saponaria officinalis TaxID=3572 RepID=A0AAW1I4Y6_SAPOF
MRKIMLLILFVVFVQQKSCVFQFLFIDATEISPVFSPINSPISPLMAEFSPGIQADFQSRRMKTIHKMKVALILACASVGVIMLSLFTLWIYHRKFSQKPRKNHAKNSVKKIDGGGQEAEKEFENEIELLSKIRHQNIITLLGYCFHGYSKFLVYELMENGCLENQLHGTSKGSALSWHTRLKIALDIARGLEYLHEHCNPPVIHRDLKSSNILLDSEFNAKLSDFGLAITDGPHSKNNIKLSGTVGYLAPEYLLDGKLTDKSDVYAFGVVLLELLLGRRPVEKLSPSQCQSIVTWAMPQLTDRSKLPNIVDPVIRDTMDLKHLYQVAAVAVLCVQPEPSYRPLITDVLHSLIPLVPVELGGTLRVNQRGSSRSSTASNEPQTV